MSTTIKCPNCRHEFAMEEAVSEQYKKDLREQMIAFTQKKEEEFRKKTQGFVQTTAGTGRKFSEENSMRKKKSSSKTLEEDLRKSIHNDFENRLSILQQSNEEQQEKLKAARQKELEVFTKRTGFKN